ncbi:MAG: TonB-dependent receptor [Cyclobacteriaceae bacterium]
MKLLFPCFLLFLFLIATSANAQRKQLISGDFTSMSFDQMVKAIEAQSAYRFYYDKRWTDTLTVNINIDKKAIEQVLEQALAGTDLHFVTDPGERVFITRERQILAGLPPGFFGEKAQRQPPSFDYSVYEKREKQLALAETKIHYIGRNTGSPEGEATIAGNIKDINTGEPLIGASVFVEHPLIGITTDQFGYYALTLPKGRHELKIQSVGMKTTSRQIMLYANGRLDIEMDEDIQPLKEVVVEADEDTHVLGIQMGTEKLDIKTMKQIPLALGETDIMKVVLTLPGVQSVGEGTVGLNVRGGAANQNLILFNDAVVYNPSHLFGFFSTFNPDVLKNVDLYKSGIQAEYGGRLSSVLDVHTREGNTKEFSGSGGISPITGRVSFEGPIIKDKTSFIIGARSTYSAWLLRQLDSKELRNSTASFHDITANVSHKIDDNNNVYLSAYTSKDRFRLNNDTAYSYSDQNASIKWKHLFNNKLYGVLTGGFSHYNYSVGSAENPVEAFLLDFDIQQINARTDFSFFPNSRHTINAGLSTIRYNISPGRYKPVGAESLVRTNILQDEQGMESAVYLSENFEVSRKLSLYFGLRYSFYQFLGPRDVFQYAPDLQRHPSNITDTIRYSSPKPIATYHGAEPRISLRYMVSNRSSVKLSYNRMRQYIQMLSNTAAINPTDIWKLSDPYLKPLVGDQLAFGFYQYVKGNSIETSIEAYYKNTESMTDYKNGAVLLLNHHLETDVTDARGKAYGVEVMIKKVTGKVNGWVSYTYSRTFIQTKGKFTDETVNKGAYYPGNYDKPNALNFIGNYKFSRRFNFSLNFIYSTGRPITLPVAKYQVDGTTRIHYSDRNQYRIPDYFRTDISVNIEGNHKIRKLAHSSWTVAVYNLFGRANPYSVYFASENGQIKGYKLSIFARPIPTITYNFKF